MLDNKYITAMFIALPTVKNEWSEFTAFAAWKLNQLKVTKNVIQRYNRSPTEMGK